MKVTQGENRNPCALVVANAMDKQNGRHKKAMNLTRDGIHHVGGMGTGIKPKGKRHLFFCQVRTGHMYHHLPESTGRLMLCWGGDNFLIVIYEILTNCSSKKLGVTVTIETPCKRASSSQK